MRQHLGELMDSLICKTVSLDFVQVTGSFSYGNISQTDLSLFSQSDISLVTLNYTESPKPLAVWVNSTNIQPFRKLTDGSSRGISQSLPSPFKRLATTSPTGAQSSIFYLYHQINESTLAEHTYDMSAGSWIDAENISITTR